MSKPTIRSRATVARPNDVFLICGPGFWGKGKTIKEAVDKAPYSFHDDWILYSVHPDTYIDQGGWWVYPKDLRGIEIDRAPGLSQKCSGVSA